MKLDCEVPAQLVISPVGPTAEDEVRRFGRARAFAAQRFDFQRLRKEYVDAFDERVHIVDQRLVLAVRLVDVQSAFAYMQNPGREEKEKSKFESLVIN